MIIKSIVRLLLDENTVLSVKTTYVGELTFPQDMSLTTAKANEVCKLTKYVETTAGSQKITETFYAVKDDKFTDESIFIWNNRATYTYL